MSTLRLLSKKPTAFAKLINLLIERGANPQLDGCTKELLYKAIAVCDTYKETENEELPQANFQLIQTYLSHGFRLNLPRHEIEHKIYLLDLAAFEELCFKEQSNEAQEYFNQKLKHQYPGNFEEAYHEYTSTDAVRLVKAIKSGKFLSLPEAVTEKNFDMNKPIFGYTPLHYACLYGQQEMLTYLLDEHHVQIDVVDSNNKTGLHMLSEFASDPEKISDPKKISAMISCLLERNAKANIMTSDGQLAIFNLCQVDHPAFRAVFNAMVKEQFDINTKINNQTLLHIACKNGFVSQVKLLLAYGAHPDCLAEDNLTPLFLATESRSNNRGEILKILLDQGANANISRKKDGRTPFLNLCHQYVKSLASNHQKELSLFAPFTQKQALCSAHVAILAEIKHFIEISKLYKQFDINQLDHQNHSAWDYTVEYFGISNVPKEIFEFRNLLVVNGINMFRITMNLLNPKNNHRIHWPETILKSFQVAGIKLPNELEKHLFSHRDHFIKILRILNGKIEVGLKSKRKQLYVESEVMKKIDVILDNAESPVNINTLLGFTVLKDYNEVKDKREIVLRAFLIRLLIERGANPHFENQSKSIIDRAIDIFHRYQGQPGSKVYEANCALIKCYLDHGFSISKETYNKYFQTFTPNKYNDCFHLYKEIMSAYQRQHLSSTPPIFLLLSGFNFDRTEKYVHGEDEIANHLFEKLVALKSNPAERNELIREIRCKILNLISSPEKLMPGCTKEDKTNLFHACFIGRVYAKKIGRLKKEPVNEMNKKLIGQYQILNNFFCNKLTNQLLLQVRANKFTKEVIETGDDDIIIYYLLNQEAYKNDIITIIENAIEDNNQLLMRSRSLLN